MQQNLFEHDSDHGDLIESQLVKSLGEYETSYPRASLAQPSNKWVASSAWQKSIRRGDVQTAKIMATALWRHESAYPWRRIGVVALEDVGAANPHLVTQIMYALKSKKWREQQGGDLKVLLYFTESLALSLKDRVSCDLEIWADQDPELASVREELAGYSRDALKTLASEPQEDLVRAHLAMRYLAGTKKFPGKNLVSGRPGYFEDVIEVSHALGLSEEHRTLLGMMRSRGGSMPLSFPYALWLKHTTEAVGILQDPVQDLGAVGPYPSHAFDLHCFQGKRAISYFSKACAPMRQWILDQGVPEKRVRDVVLELLFRAETDLLDRRLDYNQSWTLRQRSAEAVVVAWTPLPRDKVAEGESLLRAHLPDMHQARLRIMNGS